MYLTSPPEQLIMKPLNGTVALYMTIHKKTFMELRYVHIMNLTCLDIKLSHLFSTKEMVISISILTESLSIQSLVCRCERIIYVSNGLLIKNFKVGIQMATLNRCISWWTCLLTFSGLKNQIYPGKSWENLTM